MATRCSRSASLPLPSTERPVPKRYAHVQSQATVLDRKYHAGAAAEVKTDDAHLAKAAPSKVKTNVQPLTIPLPGRKLYLLPDRLLVSDAVGLGQSITSGSK